MVGRSFRTQQRALANHARLGGYDGPRFAFPADDLPGLGDAGSARRVLKIATLDTFGLDDSLARSKVLIAAAGAAVKLLDAQREENWGWVVEDEDEPG